MFLQKAHFNDFAKSTLNYKMTNVFTEKHVAKNN